MSQDAQQTTTTTVSSATVINIADRIAARDLERAREAIRLAAGELPTWSLRPGADAGGWTVEEMRRDFHPTVNSLPFITRSNDANPFSRVVSFWNDTPTGNGDHARGRHYANLLVAAMAADRCGGRPLEQIISAIIDDGMARRKKGGRGSRSMTPTVDGFLRELGRLVCSAIEVYSKGGAQ